MSDDLPETGPGPAEDGSEPQQKKHTWLVCCCIGCSVAFLAFTVAGLLYWSLLTSFLRSILFSR
jgi:hypothetical protein